jgi:hypothetical protein
VAATPRRRMMPAGSATLAILVALAVGFGGGWLFKKETTPTTTTTTTTTTSSTTTTSTTVVASIACVGSSLSGTVGTSGGAAGTIQTTIDVSNVGTKPCSIKGYPSVQLLDANQTPMTTTEVQGMASFSPAAANAAPRSQHLAVGATVEFVLQYSDVPSGTETTCPAAASINVYPPGSATSFNVAMSITPCSLGTLNVSPFFSGT